MNDPSPGTILAYVVLAHGIEDEVKRPRVSAIYGIVAALSAVLLTGAYSHRSVYLLPYLLLAAASSASWFLSGATRVRLRYASIAVLLTFMLLWSSGLSLGARTYVAWKERENRDPTALATMLQTNLGLDFRKAYFVPYELYYAGRELGWALYKTYLPEDWSNEELLRLVSEVDVVVERADHRVEALGDELRRMGFKSKTVKAGQKPVTKFENYGEYIIYLRQLDMN